MSQAKRKAAFLSIPEIAGLHSKLVLLHGELLAARPGETASSPVLRAVIEEAAGVDVTHDALARAVHAGITDADPTAIAMIRQPILKASARAGKRYGAPEEDAEALEGAEDADLPDDDEDAPAVEADTGLG